MKHSEEDKGISRAKTFLEQTQASPKPHFTKHGSIQNKDLAIEMCAQDWQLKYDDILGKYTFQYSQTHELTTLLIKKQEMYILRE